MGTSGHQGQLEVVLCRRKCLPKSAKRALKDFWQALSPYALAGLLLLRAGHVSAAAEVGDVLIGNPRVVDGDTLVVGLRLTLLFRDRAFPSSVVTTHPGR